MMNHKKYKRMYTPVPDFNRTWPDKEIQDAPAWCSVDLRDGNQALFSPMTLQEKIAFFQHLVEIGFKEIEVGFPAASDTEYFFIRKLIDDNLIPDDVAIQVLTQARPHIIEKTVESVIGAKNVIIHLYNSTSALQRDIVFHKDQEDIVQLAVDGAKYMLDLSKKLKGTHVQFEYSPESFTCTEPEFAVQICNAVLDVLKPTPDNQVIINLPTSIEVATPNVFADQVEYVQQNLKYRENVILSVHTHNDRGCAIASSELALLAGAQRVEGTLFGNGERTGNADIVTIALNMYCHGVDPKLRLDNIDHSISIYEQYNKLPVHPRQPYSGELAYTAFSGSHQDAIKKSMDAFESKATAYWENPYLTIDPTDIGRTYEPIQINSQSGRGGIHYVMENKFGFTVPKAMLTEFSKLIKHISDSKASVLSPDEIYDSFENTYINQAKPVKLVDYHISTADQSTEIQAVIQYNGQAHTITSNGNGPLDAISNGLKEKFDLSFELSSYNEHAVTKSSSSLASAYISITDDSGNVYWGAGLNPNINTASIYALISAINRML